MEAVPIHRSPSSPSISISSRSSLSNTLGDSGPPQRPPNIITRIKSLSGVSRFPSRKLNVHPGHDLPVAVVVEPPLKPSTVRRSKSRKRNLRNKTKEWLLAALTILLGGFIAGVFVITGIESAASAMRHKYNGSRWNSSITTTFYSQATPIPTNDIQASTLAADDPPLDPTEIPYSVEVMPDLIQLTTCSNPTVDDGIAFPLSMTDPGFISCYSCVLLTSPTSDGRVVAVVVDSYVPQSNSSLLINAKTYNKLNTAHENGSDMLVMWQPSNC